MTAASEGRAARANNEFTFKDMSFTVQKGAGILDKMRGKQPEFKHIVRGVSATVKAGQVFAIMGPSGAGKTTLLNALTKEAFGGVARGTIALNGAKLDAKNFRRRCCVVAQQDNHWAFLRARETVEYAAKLYLARLTNVERRAHVDDMMTKMGMVECANTRVGNQFIRGLSGGQKRRLSLAVALIKNPDVMFLDEPTSGLDAAAALNIMEFVRELAAEENIIMIATIHQPSTVIYNSFSKVMVLANGRVAYSGDTEELVPHFEQLGFQFPANTNPAEFVLECVNREFTDHKQVDNALDAWEQDSRSKVNIVAGWASPLTKEQEHASSIWRETAILLQRHGKLVLSDPMIYLGRALMFMLMCSFFAVIYVDTRNRTQEQATPKLFLLMWHVGVPTNLAIIGVYAFNSEFFAIKREVKNGMVRPGPYLLANTLLQIPAIFLLAICALSVSGYGIGAWYGANYILMVITFALVLWAFESMAQLFSVLFANPMMGMLNFMNLWFAAFLFSGVMVAEKDVIWPFRVFNFIMPFKWGLRTMAYLDINSVTYEGADLCTTANESGCLYHDDRLPGWKCAWNPATKPCLGHEGWQVLESIGNTFDCISNENTTLEDMMIVLGIGFALKFLYIMVFSYKAARASHLQPETALEATPKVKAVSITHAKSGGSAADRNGMRSGRIDAV